MFWAVPATVAELPLSGDRHPITKRRSLWIYGAGGFGREVAWLAQSTREPWAPSGFIDDSAAESATSLNNIRVRSLQSCLEECRGGAYVVAIGHPEARIGVAARAEAAGLVAATLVHRNVESSDFVEVGDGTLICAGSVLTVNIRIGRHVHINLHCTIGHDAFIEDFVTLAPGVHISGFVRIERGAYLGTGAVVINGTREAPIVIGAGATVGAGAVVTRSVPPKSTVVGVPARPR